MIMSRYPCSLHTVCIRHTYLQVIYIFRLFEMQPIKIGYQVSRPPPQVTAFSLNLQQYESPCSIVRFLRPCYSPEHNYCLPDERSTGYHGKKF